MGLERVSKVADRLKLREVKKPLILVGGTNGKGSTIAILSAIYREAGYKVGAYTSPHIVDFCERIRIDGVMVDQSDVVDALAFIEDGRAPETLTYFEYTTLAAMRVFDVLQCDLLLFEVGLGGRLDATNIWNADCSVITSIALDHEAYLGSDISVIATEKAAIGRSGKPFVVGEVSPPASLAEYAAEHSFDVVSVGAMATSELPETTMSGDHQRRNAGCALAAVNALQSIAPVDPAIVPRAILNASLAGRFERTVVDNVTVIFDVAHNPAGAIALAQAWSGEFASRRCDIIFAVLADKDVKGVVAAIAPIVDTWHCLTLDAPRASSAQEISSIVRRVVNAPRVLEYQHVEDALSGALESANVSGRPLLVTGSFHTIASVQSSLSTFSESR